MKYFLPVIFIIILALYLQQSYTYFYDYFNGHFLTAPAAAPDEGKPEIPKFVTLGDSLLDGVGASSEEASFGYLLHKSLDTKGEMSLRNLAVSGATVNDVLVSQIPDAIKSNPKEVVILIGINDVHDLTRIQEFEKDYREILSNLTSETSAKITLINIPFLGSDLILRPPWDLYMDLKTRQFNNVISKVASDYNLKLIDLYGLTKNKFKKSSTLYSSDQFHPSDEGYALWVKLINGN